MAVSESWTPSASLVVMHFWSRGAAGTIFLVDTCIWRGTGKPGHLAAKDALLDGWNWDTLDMESHTHRYVSIHTSIRRLGAGPEQGQGAIKEHLTGGSVG